VLYRCIYTSTLAPAVSDAAIPEVLAEIERQSAVNNGRARISGILLSTERHFMQILEGTNRALSSLIDNLYRDERHTDMLLMEMVSVERRVFPEWTMKWAPLKTRPEFAASVWNPDKLTAQAILHLAKRVRAGLPTTRAAPDLVPADTEVYL